MESDCSELHRLFFRILDDSKAEFATYIYRYPPDKEWTISELFSSNPNNANNIHSIHPIHNINKSINVDFSHGIIDCYKLAKTLSETLAISIKATQLFTYLIPDNLLHANIQIILVTARHTNNMRFDEHIVNMLCVQFLRKYVDHIIEESNDGIMKIISKLKMPINEIISFPSNSDVVKKSSIGIAIIVNDLIDLYKLKKNKLRLIRREFDFRKFMYDIESMIECKLHVDDDVPDSIYADQRRLKQVLMNLVNSESEVYVESSIFFELSDDDIMYHKLDFNINNAELITEERLFITKKLISLMDGSLSFDNSSARFTMRVFKDSHGYSTLSIKKIRGKKILIVDNNANRIQEITERLNKWSVIIVDQYSPYDAVIVNSTMIDKINTSKPFITIDSDARDTDGETPRGLLINSPRSRAMSHNYCIKYPFDNTEILCALREIFL